VPILLAEAAAAFEDLTLGNLDDQLAWQEKEAWPNTFRAARFISAVDLVQADRLRRQVVVAFAALFEKVDALLAPAYSPLLLATNFTGHPALALRAGFEQRRTRPGFDDTESPDTPRRDVPRAVTLYGGLYADGALAEIGLALERELAVNDRKPPGF
jgi:Asp-tRNA(Asn)/Glu-tRNA(Gln) amidotransferase A subunit family amidase